jgi:hypothetical protein
MNVAMGVGGTLTLIAGVLFFVVAGMTMFAGRKLPASELGDDLSMLAVTPTREFRYTPTALRPGALFVVIVLMFTAGAFGIMRGWPIHFG